MSKKLSISVLILLIVSSAISVQIVSSDPLTQPSQLQIYASPPSVPADNHAYNCIFVQLQDSDGNPARAPQDINISLSSSLTEIGTIDPSIIIPKGSTYGSANFSATYTPGTTTITAAATGYKTVQAPMATVGPKPYTVAVYGFPSTLPADGGVYDAVMVQLQDSSGSPAKAPLGGTDVTLSCSNTSIGDVTPTVTIAEGQTYAIATFTTTTLAGSADITPVASDYTSQKATITTQYTSTVNQLQISTGPSKVLADNCAYKQIAVELLDGNGNLGAAAQDVTVTIASNDVSIGRTETQITIPHTQSYALATLTTTYKAGVTTLTAAATNYVSASQTITTTGYTASKLGVYCVPTTLPADKGTYQAVQVQLQDSQGQPAPAPSDLTLSLFSSQPTVGTITPRLAIPLGQTIATGTLTATNAPGDISITAQSSGYITGQATVSTATIDFLPLSVTVTADPSSIYNANQTQITAYVSSDGNPITGATVHFTSDNNGTFTQAHEDQPGYYTSTFTAATFAKTTTCTITANITKTNYISTKGTTEITIAVPENATLSSSDSSVTGIGRLRLKILDNAGNFLSDVAVSSIAGPDGAQTLSGTTNATGYVTFQNLTAGSYTFQIVKLGYQTLSQMVDFSGNPTALVLTLNSGSTQSGSSGGNNMLLIIGGAVAAVIVLVICVALVRRRKPKKAITPLSWPTSL